MEVIINEQQNQFNLKVDGQVAKILYEISGDKIYLTSAQVPDSLSGQGIGSRLVKESLEIIENENLRVVPICPFIIKWFKRHPEKESLLA